MHLRFGETESAFDYMMVTREYIDKHGKPVAFYSDKHAVFRVSQAEKRNTGSTQYGTTSESTLTDALPAPPSPPKTCLALSLNLQRS